MNSKALRAPTDFASITPASALTQSIKENWVLYVAGVAALFLTSTTEVLAPKFVQWGIDALSGRFSEEYLPQWFVRDSAQDSLWVVVWGFAILSVAGGLGRCFWRQTLARRSHQATRDLKVGMWNVLRLVPLRTIHKFTLGDLMNRATGDLNSSRSIYGFTIVLTFDMCFFAILAVIAMLMIDWQLGLLCLALFPILPPFISRLARREYQQHARAQDKLSHLSDLISQTITAIRLQRATASDDLWQRALSREADEYARRRYQVIRTGLAMFPLGAAPTIIAYAILLVGGVSKIAAGTLTVGEFVALQSYVMLLQVPLFELGDVISEWQRGLASLKRIVEVFNLRGHLPNYRGASTGRHADDVVEIEIRRLNYTYEAAAQPALRQVDLSVNRGEWIGIFGSIGSGKSTLLKVMAGLVEIPENQVKICGEDVGKINREILTSKVTMVPQRAFLFSGSIRYNLVLNDKVSDDEIWKILEVVSISDDIKMFPEGLDTWVGEWGINLSGGQKQRLALARALLRPRPLLLLDDCLSAVDAETEERILARMDDYLGHRTVVWVAHRRSTLKLCDRIFSMEDGVLRGETTLEMGEK